MAKRIDKTKEYNGYVTYEIESDEELASFYENPDINTFDLYTNQYCILMRDDNVIDEVKWDGEKNISVSYKGVNNSFMGKVKPRNIQ